MRHFKRHSSEASEGQVKINREAAVSNMRKSDAFDDPLASFAMADVVRTQKDYDQLAKSKHHTAKQTKGQEGSSHAVGNSLSRGFRGSIGDIP